MNASLDEKLRNVRWGEYRLGDLFYVQNYKKKFDANKVTVLETGKHPYIVRMGGSNGQKGFINENEKYLNEGNTLSFGQDTATVFYQEKPYFTGDKIKILKCKNKRFGKQNAQFFVAAVTKAFASFSWGSSSYGVDTIENQIVRLPTKNGEIDFDFMETFIAELEAERVAELSDYLTASKLNNFELTADEIDSINKLPFVQWKEYRMGDLFDKVETKKLSYQAKELPEDPTNEYVLPCLTSSFHNQGLNYYAPKSGATIIKNVISIPSNSDVYRAYFQSRDFTVLSDAYAVRWKYNDNDLSSKQYLFMVSCINKVTDRPIYSHKNKLGGWNVVKNKYIQLPLHNGDIDLDFMETLISAIQKLLIRDVVRYTDMRLDAAKKLTVQ